MRALSLACTNAVIAASSIVCGDTGVAASSLGASMGTRSNDVSASSVMSSSCCAVWKGGKCVVVMSRLWRDYGRFERD